MSHWNLGLVWLPKKERTMKLRLLVVELDKS
jgi:hypothetical protein